MVDGERSNFVAVLSGVPQGSVISPVLFLADVNDPPAEHKIKGSTIRRRYILYLTITSEDHRRELQDDLEALTK